MQYFDELCPVSSRVQRHICFVMPLAGRADDARYVEAMRRFVGEHAAYISRLRMRLVYVNTAAQREFAEPFMQHINWEQDVRFFAHESMRIYGNFLVEKARYSRSLAPRVCKSSLCMAAVGLGGGS